MVTVTLPVPLDGNPVFASDCGNEDLSRLQSWNLDERTGFLTLSGLPEFGCLTLGGDYGGDFCFMAPCTGDRNTQVFSATGHLPAGLQIKMV